MTTNTTLLQGRAYVPAAATDVRQTWASHIDPKTKDAALLRLLAQAKANGGQS